MIQLKEAVPLELEDLSSLISMIVSGAPQEHASVLYFKHNDEHIFASFVILPGYYELRALPLLIFVRDSRILETKKRFIRYRVVGDINLDFVDTIDEKDIASGMVRYVPIVRVKRKPTIFGLPEDKE